MSATGAPAHEAPGRVGARPGAGGALAPARRAGSGALALWRRIPRAGRACFLIAFVNAAIWGFVVPPFQVPDEIAHFGYAQYLAETGKAPPQGPGAQYSQQEQTTLENLQFFSVIGHAEQRGILTPVEDRALRSNTAHTSPVGQGGASSVTNQPPLYYALEAVPYWLSPSGSILFRLQLMRLLSALIAAGTVLCVFMFLRELLPRSPWTWTVGALVAAFQPTFDFIAAGVHGDNLLFFTSTLTIWLLTRAYRRGLTVQSGAVLGAAIAAGVLSKLTFIALLPGIALALLVLAWRAARTDRAQALKALGVAVAVAAAPVALYALLNVVAWNRGSPTAGGLAAATNSHLATGKVISLNETLDYTWELFLPRLWFMHHLYFEKNPLWWTWFNGSIGHFGWLDYTFPKWVYDDSRYLLYVLVGMAAVGVLRARAHIRPLGPLFVCFAVMLLGLIGAIGYAGIRYVQSTGFPFEQARYLFPLVSFYALFIVLAARAGGRRWGPAIGAALVLLAMAHGLFAETLTISRYYG